MRTMLLLACALAACGGSSASTPAPSNAATGPSYHQKVLADMTSFRDRMCACADKACGDALMNELNAWGQEMSKNPDADSAPPDDLQPKLTDASDGFYVCKKKVVDGEVPGDQAPP